jgi:uncharacterized protein YndB with AHSA1/START domain
MPDIMHLIKIRASPEQVYRALTTPEAIRNWWTRDAVLDSKIGGTGEFGFFEGRIVTKMEVEELKPPVRVGWKIVSSAARGWDGRGSRSICERMGATQCSPSRIAASRRPTKATRVRRRVGGTI